MFILVFFFKVQPCLLLTTILNHCICRSAHMIGDWKRIVMMIKPNNVIIVALGHLDFFWLILVMLICRFNK